MLEIIVLIDFLSIIIILGYLFGRLRNWISTPLHIKIQSKYPLSLYINKVSKLNYVTLIGPTHPAIFLQIVRPKPIPIRF